ncbi:MAG: small multi-drug export protein [Clostridia bacterium]|nr:small multi-drug export protein [Clostridia bacterium]
MAEWIKNLFVAIFGDNSWLATTIISMIPIVELRGAIPFGSAISFWGENALPVWKSFLFSVLGSTLVCVILTFLFWPIFKWLKKTKFFKKLAEAIENKLNRSSKNINDKVQAETNEKKTWWIKWLGVFAFVSIPLPLTGVWTGTCIALFIGLSKKDTMISVILGNLVAGTIMMIISYFFADNTMIVLLVFFALVALFILYFAVRAIVKKIKNKKNIANEVNLVETTEIKEIESAIELDVLEENNEEVIVEEIADENVEQEAEENLETEEIKETKTEENPV